MALRALLRAIVRSPKRNQPQDAAPESTDIATAPPVQKEIEKPDGWAEVYPPGWSGTPLNDAPNWSGRAAGGFYCINNAKDEDEEGRQQLVHLAYRLLRVS